ncbi:hypothetical protein RHGRI_034306 [Rhododendron griersonianum]|uniref:Uncharacterized protein n=1 Tax=Rhododendron griersonianum TaxID=479676 RepID=A0AAV6I3Y7_9ERIC|nr:hypothetical protein RHGRI_034306 [Rhododendron griersonianum]
MENEIEKSNKHMKNSMEINIPSGTEMPSLTSPPPTGSTGLARQGSITKNNNCLCSPTNHAGSFRCRLHRTPIPPASTLTGLLRTKSIDSPASSLKDSHSNKANDTSAHETSATT